MQTHTGSSGQTISTPVFVGAGPSGFNGTITTDTAPASPPGPSGPGAHPDRPKLRGCRSRLCWLALPLALLLAAWALLRWVPFLWRQRP